MRTSSVADLIRYVDIEAETSAIIMGKYIVADGYADRPVRIVTHAHYDHILGLKENIYRSEVILATPATHDLIITLNYIRGKEAYQLYNVKRRDLNYYEKFKYKEESITFLPTDHVLGAAQVVVEADGIVIGYTGDFKLTEKTQVIEEPSILIIESTYGDPSYRRPFKDEVEDLLVDLVLDGLDVYGRVIIYGYHGKIQEAMNILRRSGIKEPFVMPRRIYEVTRIAENYGYNIGEYYNIKDEKGKEVLRSGKYIMFDHFNNSYKRKLRGDRLHVILSGWEFSEPIRRIDDHTWLVALSDHADFDELIEYVERSKPRLVVIDGSRQGNPKTLARELNNRGWRAIVLPGPKVVDEVIV